MKRSNSENSDAVVTKAEFEDGLRKLGVKSGMMLEVHSSLSSFGHVVGGAQTIIDTLKSLVGAEGAIVMPSFKDSHDLPLTDADRALGLTLKLRLLNGDEERSGMGIVADTFRAMSDVKTGEGHFRVSAWGRDAEIHAANWFSHLINNGGYTLLLGVDIYKMSSMHEAEDDLPKEIKERSKPTAAAYEIYPETEWFIEAVTSTAKPWYTIQQRAYDAGYVTDVTIGNSRCMLLETKNVVELYRSALQENAFALYGLA